MELNPGARISACDVVGSLGAGGTGEVYREAALTILPQTFASDSDRVVRFSRGSSGRHAEGGDT